MRLDHWIKQFFILPGFVCAIYLGKYSYSWKLILDLVIGLLATSLIASANYVINEYLDAEFDKYVNAMYRKEVFSVDCVKFLMQQKKNLIVRQP